MRKITLFALSGVEHALHWSERRTQQRNLKKIKNGCSY